MCRRPVACFPLLILAMAVSQPASAQDFVDWQGPEIIDPDHCEDDWGGECLDVDCDRVGWEGSLLMGAGPNDLAPFMLGDVIGVIIGGPPPAPDPRVRKTDRDVVRVRTAKLFKVADNNSPIPVSRALYSFNWFEEAFETDVNVYRHFAGAELAFFDRLFSITVKPNYNFISAVNPEPTTENGTLTVVFKGVLGRSRSWLVSGGLLMGVPMENFPDGVPYDLYLSPWVGYVIAPPGARWYIQGYEQLDLPTEGVDQILLQSDIGVGFWLVDGRDRQSVLRGLVPTAELHLYTPLEDGLNNLEFQDVLNATVGVTAVFGDGITLATGFAVPLLSDRHYDYEIQAHLNLVFPRPIRD